MASDVKSNHSLRNSNIELLRIIAMLLIVARHAAIRQEYLYFVSDFKIYASAQIFGSWGILGIDLFLIISAWFLVDQQFHFKRVINILFHTFTYIFAFSVLSFGYECWKLGSFMEALKSNVVETILAILQPLWSDCYWFITAYVFMLIISPFLNKILNKLPPKTVKNILLAFIFVPVFCQFSRSPISDAFYFAYVYLLIGYFKKYCQEFWKKNSKPLYFIVVTVIIIISRLACFIPVTSMFIAVVQTVLNSTLGACGRNSMIILIDSLFIFFWVINLKPFYNKFINSVAESTLGVYLFHENNVLGFPNILNLIFNKLTDVGFITGSVLFPLQYIAGVLIVYIAGIIVEFIRQKTIQKPFMKFVTAKYSEKLEKIDNWFNLI